MKRSRLGWLVWPALVAVLIGGAGVMLLTWQVSMWLGGQAMQQGRLLDAERHYTRAVPLPVESWKAPFNRGVARYEQERWDAAASDFELAALRAPVEHDCMIRLNWSQALERSADALRRQDDPDSATARYQSALLVLASAACDEQQRTASGQSGQSQKLQGQQRLAGKAGQSTRRPSDGSSADGTEREQQIDERAEQAQQERQRNEQKPDPRAGGEGERTW
ncbi:hypothetical protein [uncultured Tessaracoccus sp.]|uniref:hypothetical protein n=1 Tax=uncultured Tessaracoccus sp. TaxID=905023 RepID=UPI0026377C4D|nr:hypothetical protein [uncultured Tessaracoccus sp.]